jgi:hypothetical protein
VLDYLHHGENAWFFDEPTPEALAQAIRSAADHLPHDVADRCRHSASKFSEACFRERFSTWVAEKWAEWQGATDAPRP